MLGQHMESNFSQLFVKLEGQGIMSLQKSIIHKRPQSGTHNGLERFSALFSVRGAYVKISEGQYEEIQPITRACKFILGQKVPSKVQLFKWLLFRRRLMRRIFYR